MGRDRRRETRKEPFSQCSLKTCHNLLYEIFLSVLFCSGKDNFSFSYFLGRGKQTEVSLRAKSDPSFPSHSHRSIALLLGSSLPEERSRHFIFGCRNKHLLCSHSLRSSLTQLVMTRKIEEVSPPVLPLPPSGSPLWPHSWPPRWYPLSKQLSFQT